MKHNLLAAKTFGYAVYDDIPKSVFAMVAYHFARQIHGDTHADALEGLRQEINTLANNGLVTASQAKRADASLMARALAQGEAS